MRSQYVMPDTAKEIYLMKEQEKQPAGKKKPASVKRVSMYPTMRKIGGKATMGYRATQGAPKKKK
jgi:hypothetical protein